MLALRLNYDYNSSVPISSVIAEHISKIHLAIGCTCLYIAKVQFLWEGCDVLVEAPLDYINVFSH